MPSRGRSPQRERWRPPGRRGRLGRLTGEGVSTVLRPSAARRAFLAASAAAALEIARAGPTPERSNRKALVAITLDLEMSAHYPRRGMTEWNYRKGDLDDATKDYAVRAGRLVREYGGVIHYFCVGQVLEQPSVDWLRGLARDGHPVGNHTYDHVNLKAARPEDLQFRFQRAPWLVRGRPVREVIAENIRITTAALGERAGIKVNGFRTPGGFPDGLADRPDLQKLLLDQGF